jgi:hypothetical protein
MGGPDGRPGASVGYLFIDGEASVHTSLIFLFCTYLLIASLFVFPSRVYRLLNYRTTAPSALWI